jgi:hypothetical protein
MIAIGVVVIVLAAGSAALFALRVIRWPFW